MTNETNKKVLLGIGVSLLLVGSYFAYRYFATKPKKNDGSTPPEQQPSIASTLGSLFTSLREKKADNTYVEQKNAIANDMFYGGLSEQELKRANELTNLDANNDCLLDGTESKEYTDQRTGKKYKGLPTQKCMSEALSKGMDVRTYIAQR